MNVYKCQFLQKWFLLAFTAAIPSFSQATVSDAEIIERHHHISSRDENRIEEQLTILFVDQTVYFHDYTFAVLETLPPTFSASDDALLRQNAALLAQAVYPKDFLAAGQLQALLINYINAGETYVNDLNALLDPTNPVVIADFNAWLGASNQLAIGFSQVNPKVIKLKRIQALLSDYTSLQASAANNLVPTAINNPDFTQASILFAEARTLASTRIAPLIAKGIQKSRHR